MQGSEQQGQEASTVALPVVYDHSHADCDACELKGSCETGRTVPAKPGIPENFNGIMIIGEGPGQREVSAGRPFVGPSGHLLDTLLEHVGIKRDECYVTNATLCLPPPKRKDESKQASFHSRFPNAIYSCLPRLEAEVAMVRPRVVICLGAPALIAATGATKQKAYQVDNDCTVCLNERKIGPALACAKGDCDWHHIFTGLTDEQAAEAKPGLLATIGDQCPKCSASLKRLRPRKVKCPACGGKKKKAVLRDVFVATYQKIGEVAGALFRASTLPARWDELGVEYVITTYHPSFLLRSMEGKDESSKSFGGQFAARAVTDHFEKALRLTKRDADFRVSAMFTDRAEDVEQWLEGLGDQAIAEIDLETDAKSPWDVSQIRCIGIGVAEREEVLVVDTRELFDVKVHEDGENLPLRFEFEVKDQILYHTLCHLFTSSVFKKVAQNGSYDWLVIRRFFGVEVGPIVADTKHGHHHLYPDEPHELGHIASEMTEAEYWKPPKKGEDGGLAWSGFEELAVYNAKDVRTTSLSRRRMSGDLVGPEPEVWTAPTGVQIRRWTKGGLIDHPDQQRRNGFDVAMELLPIAIEMEYHGVPVDLDAMKEIEADLAPKRAALEMWMREYVGRDDFLPTSAPQLAWALFDPNGPCKLTSPGTTKKGAASTSKDVLVKLTHHEFVQNLLEWKRINSNLSTFVYGKGLIIREDGCIHPSWNTAGPVTHRWSSSPNFQNWPLIMRRLIVAPPGWLIVGADESQLEMRILAALSGDAGLIKRCVEANEKDKLNPECDPHAYVGSNFFGAAYDELVPDRFSPEGKKKLDALRTIVKTVFYALGYGSGAQTVLEGIYKKGYEGSIPLTLQIVRGAMNKIYELFPGLATYAEDAIRLAKETWEVRSKLLGRCRPFPLGDVESTVARNFPIQATAADLVDLRFIEYRRRLRDASPRSYPILQVHDAIYTLAPEEDAEAVAKVKAESLSTELVLVPGAPPMPFVASAKIGKTLLEVS